MKVTYSHYEVLCILLAHAKATQPMPEVIEGVNRLSMSAELVVEGKPARNVEAAITIDTVPLSID